MSGTREARRRSALHPHLLPPLGPGRV